MQKVTEVLHWLLGLWLTTPTKEIRWLELTSKGLSCEAPTASQNAGTSNPIGCTGSAGQSPYSSRSLVRSRSFGSASFSLNRARG